VDAGNHVLDWGPDPPNGKGQILRGEGATHCIRNTLCGVCTVTCVKMTDLIVMSFGLWARTRPRNHELDGDRDHPTRRGNFGEKDHPL